MAKSKKRQVSRGSRLSETQRQAAPSAPATKKAESGANRPTLSSEFNPDYTFVKQDLRKIGIMAASFISILVILSFFLG